METVECHSGFKYGERPQALTWQGSTLPVAAVLAQARTPWGVSFLVRTEDGRSFRLEYREAGDSWQIQPV